MISLLCQDLLKMEKEKNLFLKEAEAALFKDWRGKGWKRQKNMIYKIYI